MLKEIRKGKSVSNVRSSRLIVLLFAFLFILSLAPRHTEAESLVDWKLFIPGEKVNYNGTHVVLVSGIEHNLTFYIGDSSEVTVFLTYSGIGDEERNYTNFYEWRYSDGHFQDVLYYTYINTTSSSVFSDMIAFHIGIHAKAKQGTWHLMVERKIPSGNETIISEDIWVEEANPRLALSTPVFEFRVEPFESGDQIPPSDKDYRFTTINGGNVPLWLSCEYDKMGEIFYTTNMSTVLHPGDELEHNIYLTSLPWSPQVFTVEEHVKGRPMYMITADMVSFIPTFQTVVKINVKVVRQGFNILDIGDAKLQYEKGPKVANYDDTMDLRLFVSGHSDASLTVSVDKLELVGLYYDGKWHNASEGDTSKTLNFHLTNDSEEEEVMVRVHCYREKVTGSVHYQLRSGSASDHAQTDIVVGSAPYVSPVEENPGINTIALIGVILIIVFLAGLMIFYHKKMNYKE